MRNFSKLAMLPGLALAIAIGVVASVLGSWVPVVGGPVFAIVIGVIVAVTVPWRTILAPGVTFASKTVLQWSIVLLGAHLSIAQVLRGGLASLPVMLVTFAVVMIAALVFGRVLGVRDNVRRLLTIGTAICGGSAIAALSGVIEADPADVAYALAAVFACNVVAVLVFPALGHAMHLSQAAFGLWAGTAINDTSSVVAAGYTYGHVAGNDAVIVKLTRVLLIVPVVVFYAWRRRGKAGADMRSIFPWFIVWFLLAATVNSFGFVPAIWQPVIAQIGIFAITVALAAVGLSTDSAKIVTAGFRPLALGALLWVVISLASLAVAAAIHYA